MDKLVDFRCPQCNRPVSGKEEVRHVKRIVNPGQCPHCHVGLTLAYDNDESIPGYYFKTAPKCSCGKPATHVVVATDSKVCSFHRPDGFVCKKLS